MRISRSVLSLALVSMIGCAHAIDINQLPLQSANEVRGGNFASSVNGGLLADTKAKQFNVRGQTVTISRAKAGAALNGSALNKGYLFVEYKDFPIVVELLNRFGGEDIYGQKITETAVWTPVTNAPFGDGIVIDMAPYGFNNGLVDTGNLNLVDIDYINRNLDIVKRYFKIIDTATGKTKRISTPLAATDLQGKKVGCCCYCP